MALEVVESLRKSTILKNNWKIILYCVRLDLIFMVQTQTMKKYTLTKTDTGHKSGRFLYTITDETGAVLSTRKSDREYVAATINGQYYFGRLDLIGKGDHGKQVKSINQNGQYKIENGKGFYDINDKTQVPIAYLVAETPAPVIDAPVVSVDEAEFQQWIAAKKAQYKAWKACSDNGTIKDDENPAFMFSTLWTSLLVKIVKGEICPQFLAGQELANRGLDKDGQWVGFEAAEKIHFGK